MVLPAMSMPAPAVRLEAMPAGPCGPAGPVGPCGPAGPAQAASARDTAPAAERTALIESPLDVVRTNEKGALAPQHSIADDSPPFLGSKPRVTDVCVVLVAAPRADK